MKYEAILYNETFFNGVILDVIPAAEAENRLLNNILA